MALMPTLFVDDVEASSRWYQTLLGAQSMHGGPDFEMLGRCLLYTSDAADE